MRVQQRRLEGSSGYERAAAAVREQQVWIPLFGLPGRLAPRRIRYFSKYSTMPLRTGERGVSSYLLAIAAQHSSHIPLERTEGCVQLNHEGINCGVVVAHPLHLPLLLRPHLHHLKSRHQVQRGREEEEEAQEPKLILQARKVESWGPWDTQSNMSGIQV